MSFKKSIAFPARLIFIMWTVFFIEWFFGISLNMFGILPRQPFSLIGIFTAPLIHGDIVHLISNTFPLFFLLSLLFYFYNLIALRVLLHCYFLPGLLVWLFGRPSFHIGASGLIYGIAAFLMFFGFFRKDFKSLTISFVILVLYGGIFYGVLPVQPGVSWESHLAGAVVGLGTALVLSKRRKVSKG
jgi:membrane associated rhomboid family serine protease